VNKKKNHNSYNPYKYVFIIKKKRSSCGYFKHDQKNTKDKQTYNCSYKSSHYYHFLLRTSSRILNKKNKEPEEKLDLWLYGPSNMEVHSLHQVKVLILAKQVLKTHFLKASSQQKKNLKGYDAQNMHNNLELIIQDTNGMCNIFQPHFKG